MPSFDIVNQLDLQEIDNAVNMVKRDIKPGMISRVHLQVLL